MSYVVRSAVRDGSGPVRVTVCTDRLQLVQFVVPYRNTEAVALDEIITAGLAAIPPTPKGRVNGNE